MVFSGYIGHPRAADRLAAGGGWGAGHIDEDGLHASSTADDLIVSGGENVARGGQAIMLEHPPWPAAVVGRPIQRGGGTGRLRRPPRCTQVEDAGLERHCRDRLASYKVPRAFQRVADLPRDALGKVRRQVLRDALEEGLR
jgi:fatty-acyl-CoA synthase